jgi:photosystem II stability/assembly factor-like uncharacterized protein
MIKKILKLSNIHRRKQRLASLVFIGLLTCSVPGVLAGGLHTKSTLMKEKKTAPVGLALDCVWEFEGFVGDFEFISEDVGFLTAERGLYKTTDGGATWIPVLASSMVASVTDGFGEIEFLNEQLGLLGDANRLLKTTDGGKTWNLILEGPYGYVAYSSISIIDENTYYVADGTLKGTTDGGKTWTTLVDEGSKRIRSIQSIGNSSFAWWFNNNTSDDSGLFKSTNNWATYTNTDIKILDPWYLNPVLTSLAFTDENTGYAAGRYGLMKSIDGGATWNMIGETWFTTNIHLAPHVFYLYSPIISTYIERFENGGSVANKLDIPATYHPFGVSAMHFFDDQNGIMAVAVQDRYPEIGTVLYRTTNGGTDWTLIPVAPAIGAPATNACLGSTQEFLATSIHSGEYEWQVTGGTIQGSATTNRVLVKWDDANNAAVHLKVTNSNCSVDLDLPVTVNTAAPQVTTTGPTALCSGATTDISISADLPATFQWVANLASGEVEGQQDGTGNTINQILETATSGTVRYAITTTQCNADSVHFDVAVHPKPLVQISQHDNDLIANCSNCTPAFIQWSFEGEPISAADGGNAQSLPAKRAGVYSVTVKDDIDCEGSAQGSFIITAIAETLSSGRISVYPVPVSASSVNIHVENNYRGIVEYSIVSTEGVALKKGTATKDAADFTTDVKVDTLPEGFYILKVTMGEQHDVVRLIRLKQ